MKRNDRGNKQIHQQIRCQIRNNKIIVDMEVKEWENILQKCSSKLSQREKRLKSNKNWEKKKKKHEL